LCIGRLPVDNREMATRGNAVKRYPKIAAMLMMIAAPIPAAAQDNPILQRMQAFAEAYNVKDSARISGFYAEDGALLPPGSKILTGRQEIADHYARAFAGGVSELKFRVLEIRQASPSTAVEIGETQVRAGDQTIFGRYLHVWAKQDDVWLLSRDMYHVIGVSR
jgi:uncharacterized protein (TIGR02246 family)